MDFAQVLVITPVLEAQVALMVLGPMTNVMMMINCFKKTLGVLDGRVLKPICTVKVTSTAGLLKMLVKKHVNYAKALTQEAVQVKITQVNVLMMTKV